MASRKKKSAPRAGSWRTCAGCRRRLPRTRGLRLVRDASGRVRPDLFGKLPGRGMYLCPRTECFELAVKHRGASRAFRQATSMDDPEQLVQSFRTSLYNQVLSLLSLCRRGGWLAAGKTQVQQALHKGRAALVLVANDAGRSLTVHLLGEARRRDIFTDDSLSGADFSRLFANRPLAAVAVSHRGLAAKIRLLLLKLNSLAGRAEPMEDNLTAGKSRTKMPDQRAGGAIG